MHLSDTSSIAQHFKKTFMPNKRIKENSYRKHNILENQNNKQKLQILVELHIRHYIQLKLNRINIETSANIHKSL